ncbi:MAG: hypothetical protein HYS07_04805 [Chlamydiae bacterium]|nr:hypothetical protein [Chlamydiota bacterium]MBI3276210.1 hypothetical protein [Chlamydiota bacterium]
MKRVAIIGPDFTPSGYPPALRIRFFAQHLQEFGWRPTVITVDPKYYEWSVDFESENLLPKGLEIIRTPAFSAGITRKVGIGDIGIRSLWYHWRIIRALCREKKVDLLFIPVPPYLPAVLGRLIYQSFGIPYVIDYIDPWVNDAYKKLPKSQRRLKRTISYMFSLFLEPIVLKKVGHVVGVSKGTTDLVIARYPWLKDSDATEVPYGGEAGDFDYLRKNPRKNQVFNCEDGLLHISYIGACVPDMYPTIRALFSAVRIGKDQSPSVFERLRLHFVGTTYAANAENMHQVVPLAREMELENIVDEHPQRIAYLDALQLLLDSHALLLVGSNRPHYTASKVFQCILARRPLLAVVHEESSVVLILKKTRAGDVVTFNSQDSPEGKIEKIREHLEAILSLPQGYQPPVLWDAFETYTTRSMTAWLAHVFDKVVSRK